MAEKYASGSWTPTSYRKYSTDTDNITTFPKTIIGDGTAVSAYTVKGNMEQSGTPTPSAPIYPSECGERTGNLFDKNATDTTKGYAENEYLYYTGEINTTTAAYNISEYIEVEPSTAYTLSGVTGNTPALCQYDVNKSYIIGTKYSNDTVTLVKSLL